MNSLKFLPEGGFNLCTYYVLPWIGLNRQSFGGGANFLNCHMSFNGKIVVSIRDASIAGEFWKREHYLTDFEADGITYIVWNLPEVFEQDYVKFLEGKYSQFSDMAKELIRTFSELPYKFRGSSGTPTTHKLLLVLTQSPTLRNWLENTLGTKIDEGSELMDRPNLEREMIDIDTAIPRAK